MKYLEIASLLLYVLAIHCCTLKKEEHLIFSFYGV